MNTFKDEIKVTEDDKKNVMCKVLYTMMNSSLLMRMDEVINIQKDVSRKLSEEEFLAIYNLSLEIRKSMESSNVNERLYNYLGLNKNSLNSVKLYEFVNAIVKDIKTTKKRNSNLKWSLQVNKIFKRMEGKDPYEEAIAEPKKARILPFHGEDTQDQK